MPYKYGGIRPIQYLKIIKNSVNKIEQSITKKIKISKNKELFTLIVKLCMCISCSDICSSYNKELLPHSDLFLDNKKVPFKIKISKMTHLSSGGAWTRFEMNKKHPQIIKSVLSLLS